MKTEHIKKISVIAILSALSFVLMLIQISVPFVPSFIQLDISEFPALIATFIFGPIEGILVCFIKNCLHLPFSTTAMVGELSNFLLGSAFTFTVGMIYKRKKKFKNAVVACLAGCFAMALVSYPVNLFITYPVYAKLLAPMNVIIDAYKAIVPSVDTLNKALLVFNIPLTFVKAVLVSVLCVLTYGKLSYLYGILRKK